MCVWQLFKEKKPPAYGKNSKLAWHRGQKGPFNTFSKNVFSKRVSMENLLKKLLLKNYWYMNL